MLRDGGVRLLKYRPEVAPWQFRSHRLRRLHRKLCHVDGRVAFVGGINLIDDMNTPRHKPPRVDFAVRVDGPLLAPIVQTMQRLWALVELAQLERSDVPLFPGPDPRRAARARRPRSSSIRDNLRHRRDIERAYLAAIRTAQAARSSSPPRISFPASHFRRALIAAAQRGVQRDAAAAGARRIPAAALRVARAVRTAARRRRRRSQEYHRSFLHAKVAVVDDHWATVGSSNIDPYSLLMAREANVFVRDPHSPTSCASSCCR